MSKPTSPSTKPPGGLIDAESIRELAEILRETDLTEIEVEHGTLRVRVAKEPAPQMVQSAVTSHANPMPAHVQQSSPPETPAPQGSADARAHPGAVPSPMVGTAYLAPEPGADPFIAVGKTVKQGDTLLLIEAMKTFNPIKAPKSGSISEILVQDGQPVEYGEALLVLA